MLNDRAVQTRGRLLQYSSSSTRHPYKRHKILHQRAPAINLLFLCTTRVIVMALILLTQIRTDPFRLLAVARV